MKVVSVLQCTLVILVARGAKACQVGEVVEARWTDGSWKRATIEEVRDGPNGMCGQYKLAWHHTRICEDATTNSQYWGDDMHVASRCLVSRGAIHECKQELCKWGGEESPASEDSSENHTGLIVAMACILLLVLLCCRVCVRLGAVSGQVHDVDEENAMGTVTPVGGGNDLWALTPKSMNSQKSFASPMAKWIGPHFNKTRRAARPSDTSKKIIVQPDPVAAVAPLQLPVAARQHGANAKPVQQNQAQPERWRDRLDTSLPDAPLTKSIYPEAPPRKHRTQGTGLRQAAQVSGVPSQPEGQPPQLPTLLQHRHGPTKSRKKPPLQGVPPQEQSRLGVTMVYQNGVVSVVEQNSVQSRQEQYSLPIPSRQPQKTVRFDV